MRDDHQLLRERLQSEGHSLTSARRAVYDVLAGREALSMKEILTLIGSKADRASVYRVVSLFEQLNVVQRLQTGWKYKIELSSIFSHHHHHLVCSSCDKVFTFEESLELEEEIDRIAWRHKFRISSHQLEIRGICEECLISTAITKLETKKSSE